MGGDRGGHRGRDSDERAPHTRLPALPLLPSARAPVCTAHGATRRPPVPPIEGSQEGLQRPPLAMMLETPLTSSSHQQKMPLSSGRLRRRAGGPGRRSRPSRRLPRRARNEALSLPQEGGRRRRAKTSLCVINDRSMLTMSIIIYFISLLITITTVGKITIIMIKIIIKIIIKFQVSKLIKCCGNNNNKHNTNTKYK